MGLVLEGSIQERRKRVLVKVKDASQPQPNPAPKHQRIDTLFPQLQPPAPTTVPAPQPPSQWTSSPAVTSASANTEAPQGPSALLEPGKESTGVRDNKPATNSAKNSSVKHTVALECVHCSAKISLSKHHLHLCLASSLWGTHFKCVGCGTTGVGHAAFCTNCKGVFI
jgi:hypothetical protein